MCPALQLFPLFSFYLFNVTNPDQVLRGGRPVVAEMGPYTYLETQEKVNITWHLNGTVTFLTRQLWHFQEQGSRNLNVRAGGRYAAELGAFGIFEIFQ